MNMRKLAQSVAYETLSPVWNEYLSGWTDSPSEQRDEALRFVSALQEEIFVSLQDAADPLDRQELVHAHYIRLKCQWQAMNTQIGYQMAAGRSNEFLFMRASLLSTLIDALEQNIEVETAEFLSRILSDPTHVLLEPSPKSLDLPERAISAEELPSLTPTDSSPPAGETESTALLPSTALPQEVTDRIQHLQTTVQLLMEQVNLLQSERDTLFLSAGVTDAETLRQRLLQEFQTTFAGDTVLLTLQEKCLSLREQLTELTIFRDAVERETRCRSVTEVVTYLRASLDKQTIQDRELYWHRFAQEILRQEFGEKTLQEVIFELRRETVRRNRLEDETAQARRERELIARELRCQNPENLLIAARHLNERVMNLEAENTLFLHDQETLKQTLGHSTPRNLIAAFRALNDQIATLSQDLPQRQANDSLLEATFGTTDAREIVKRYRQAQLQSTGSPTSTPELFDDLEAALALLK